MKTKKIRMDAPSVCKWDLGDGELCGNHKKPNSRFCEWHLQQERIAAGKEHTPTPWKRKWNLNTIEGANGLTVCDLRSNTEDADADAAFIVRAVNNFERAIKYLEIEHREERAQSFHTADCDLCEFIAKAEAK